MKIEELIERLRTYNAWRRGAENEMPDPQQTGQDIDAAIAEIEKYEKLKKRCNEIYNQNRDMMSTLRGFYDYGYDRGTCWKTIERNGGDA
jgi:hypothetical protein